MVILAAAVLLLAVSGATKIVRPRPTAQALADLLGQGPWLVRATRLRVAARVLGAGELALAVTATAFDERWTRLGVTGAYLAFAAVLVVQLRAGLASSCGCVGEAPASPAHLVLTLGAAAGCAAAPGLPHAWVPLAVAGLLAWLALQVMTSLAEVSALVRRPS